MQRWEWKECNIKWYASKPTCRTCGCLTTVRVRTKDSAIHIPNDCNWNIRSMSCANVRHSQKNIIFSAGCTAHESSRGGMSQPVDPDVLRWNRQPKPWKVDWHNCITSYKVRIDTSGSDFMKSDVEASQQLHQWEWYLCSALMNKYPRIWIFWLLRICSVDERTFWSEYVMRDTHIGAA